jgi:hypothetical protein
MLGATALGGTLGYAASFRALPDADWLPRAGAGVGLAAGISWLTFGGVLLVATGARPSTTAWADACLRTMAAGIAVLALAAALNVACGFAGMDEGPLLAAAHAVLLGIANGVMCLTFVRRAHFLGLSRGTALGLWMLVLNGTFALILMFLYGTGVM